MTTAEVADLTLRLIDRLHPHVVGISGLPGCGKTTLARDVAGRLGPRALSLSMDDFYLSKVEREAAGLRWRGGPGSHDLDLLASVLDDIRARQTPIEVPRYSGERDDRDEPVVHDTAPDVVLLDGWFLGYPGGRYAEVLHGLDLLIFLEIPLDVARQQRFAREDALRASGGGFSEEQMQRFWDEVLAPGIETLVPEARASADVVIALDAEHRIADVRASRADVRAALDSPA